MANKMRMPISIPEFTIKDRESYSAGDSIRSPLSGPTDAFRFSLLIFPSGTEVSRTDRNQLRSFRPLSAFVEATPPQAMKDYSPENAGYEGWKCMNVRYSIMVRSQTARNSDLKFDDTFDFSEQQADRGWHDLFKNETHPRTYTRTSSTGEDEVVLAAEVWVPWAEQQRAAQFGLSKAFVSLDFAEEPKFATFRLAEGSLFFDQRLLISRSEYFRNMLASNHAQDWRESRTGQIDLRKEEKATCKSMSAILRFILTDSFSFEDLETAQMVRALADQFCLFSLVAKVDLELLSRLTTENVLELLEMTLDSGNQLEDACWKMLEADGELLEKQAEELEAMIAKNPKLGRKLVLFGLGSSMARLLSAVLLLTSGRAELPSLCESEVASLVQKPRSGTDVQACQGFKCERGHPAFGARPKRKAHKASALQTLQSDSDYAFEINEDGVWNTYFLPGATIIDKRTVNYGINDKYYLMAKDTTDYSNAANFHKVALAGKTIITTVNLNGAGCGCNVNFFLVNMPASSPGQYGDYYCDANCVGGNCCAEFDINEMNTHALQVTNHNCFNPPSHSTCDGNGDPLLKFLPGEFGPGSSNTIDTDYVFNFSLQAQENINPSDSTQNYLEVYARLWQNGKTVTKSMGGIGSPLNVQWENLADGMVLVIDYWQSGDLTWLDGASCTAPESCSGNHADLSNMTLITNALETSGNCPEQEAANLCNDIDASSDDASEHWCKCACASTRFVPRCLWSGYSPAWAV
ncbi:4-beta-glucanase) [Durusdinium trenchii]|uniref:4-beta-glucanase n=1 Tax=Durusdinium trenchii TaxID=1381693 RepID=A0ABP0L1N5_9DINO